MTALKAGEGHRVRITRALVQLVAAGLLVATALSFLGRLSWVIELFAHFRPHLAAASAVTLIVAALAQSRAAIAVSLLLVFVNFAPIVSYRAGARATPDTAGVALNVLALNLHGEATDREKFRRLLTRADPDIVLLTELPRDTGRLLGEAAARYPYSLQSGRADIFEILVLSRWRPKSWHVDRSVARWLPVLVADLCGGAGPESAFACMRVVGLHPPPPFGVNARLRDSLLALAGRFAAEAGGRPAVLMGDFNLTPWAPGFAALVKDAGLKDTGQMRALRATWISPNPFIGLLIDHILVRGNVTVLESKVGANVGSDHLPVVARLNIGAPGP